MRTSQAEEGVAWWFIWVGVSEPSQELGEVHIPMGRGQGFPR